MTAINPPGPTGYGPIAAQILPDSSVLVSTEDGIETLSPVITATSAAIVQNLINTALQGAEGPGNVPGLFAILIELRVANELTAINMGVLAPDLTQLRASIAFDINPATGVL